MVKNVVIALLATMAAQPAIAVGDPAFSRIGTQVSYANGVSGDGSVVVGSLQSPNHAFRWTWSGGIQDLGTFGGAPTPVSEALGVNSDGSLIAGWSSASGGTRAFRYSSGTGLQNLGAAPGWLASFGNAISADGTTVVGRGVDSRNRAFRWTSTGGIQIIGALPQHFGESTATGVSGDGSIVVGISGSGSVRRAFRWTSGGMQELPLLPNAVDSAAYAISEDGATIVGWNGFGGSTNPSVAVCWTNGGGLRDLGRLPGGEMAAANSVCSDGSIIVGGSGVSGPDGGHAFLWTQALGLTDLQTYLPSVGINLAGWVLYETTGISSDGSTIVGRGSNNGVYTSWVANINVKDSDGDGLLDDWEVNGIPYTRSDGTQDRFVLADANAYRKDIYVEVDAMTGFAPSQATLSRVHDVFFSAQVPTPPGCLNGVNLHVMLDETNLNPRPYPNGFTDFQADKSGALGPGGFGTSLERTDPNWINMKNAKRKAFRYCIFGSTYTDAHGNTCSGGLGELPGNDFMVTLGCAYQAGYGASTIEDMQCRTFMHELGHTLGLNHGGAVTDDINNKPNYYSVMNYTWQMPSRWAPEGCCLFYSDDTLPSLNESALSESTGLGGNHPFVQVPFSIPIGSSDNCTVLPSYSCLRYARFGWPVNWDNNANVDRTDVRPGNINYFPDSDGTGVAAEQVLDGHDDWANLLYSFIASPAYAEGFVPSSAPVEMDVTAYPALMAAPPPNPLGDLNCDGTVNSLDIQPFILAIISRGAFSAQYPLCDIGNADMNGDGNLDTADVQPFVDRLLSQQQ